MAAVVEHRRQLAEWHFPPVGRLLRVDDAVLHYVAAGEGDPVVMIHGAGSLLQDFLYSLMGPVAKTWRALAFDRPGYGYSSRPSGDDWTLRRQAAVLCRAFQELGVKRPIVVGHSAGAAVALALALDHPDSVAGLVLLGGLYYPESRPDFAPLVPLAVPGLSAVTTHTVGPFVMGSLLPLLYRRMFQPNPVPAWFKEAFPHELLLRPSHLRSTARDASWLLRCVGEMSQAYRFLRVPVAVLAGGGDRMVDPRRHAVRLAQAVPHASLTVLPDVGHMLHHVAPASVVAAIAQVATEAAAWS